MRRALAARAGILAFLASTGAHAQDCGKEPAANDAIILKYPTEFTKKSIPAKTEWMGFTRPCADGKTGRYLRLTYNSYVFDTEYGAVNRMTIHLPKNELNRMDLRMNLSREAGSEGQLTITLNAQQVAAIERKDVNCIVFLAPGLPQ